MPAPPEPNADGRLFPLDATRGLIIAFMALDHASYFIARAHSPGEHWGGPFPTYTAALPFLTRLVTHLCAPGFFFLMGAGISLFTESRRHQGWKDRRIILYLWARGALLVALQFLVINPIWKAGLEPFPVTYIGVLVALGGTLILASLLIRMNSTALGLLALVMLVGTELLHPSPDQWGTLEDEPWNLVLLRSGGDGTLWSNYPLLPWLELVLFGMSFGRWLLADRRGTYVRGLWLGITLVFAFAAIRYLDGFGNIRPRTGDTWIDFFNVVKYPPSLAFTSLTMGVNLILLYGFSRGYERFASISQPLLVLGREPLFLYVTHLGLYMLLGRMLSSSGTSLPGMFPYWLAGLMLLYPLALVYGRFKKDKPPGSVWRFL